MRIVLDANIVIAALMGSKVALTIITSQNHTFYVPSRILNEVKKYKQFICDRCSLTQQEFNQNFEALLVFINVLEHVEYDAFLEKAQRVMSHRDSEDADYVACALAINADFIWTNDKDFKVQTLISTKTTQEFIDSQKK